MILVLVTQMCQEFSILHSIKIELYDILVECFPRLVLFEKCTLALIREYKPFSGLVYIEILTILILEIQARFRLSS